MTLWTYVISMDEAEMLVDAGVDHQPECPGKDKSKWTFRVPSRFVGCGPDEDVWLPFTETNPLCRLGSSIVKTASPPKKRPAHSVRSTSTLTSTGTPS
jgi:hypothetical protein